MHFMLSLSTKVKDKVFSIFCEILFLILCALISLWHIFFVFLFVLVPSWHIFFVCLSVFVPL